MLWGPPHDDITTFTETCNFSEGVFQEPITCGILCWWLFITKKQLPCFPAYTTKLHLAAYFNIGWLIYDTLMAGIDPNAIADMYDTSLA